MSDKREKSPGGSDILRHEKRDLPWTPAAATDAMPEIEQHFARYFGEARNVLHEIVSDLVHIDVHVIEPRPDRNWWTLFTTGMSDLPMTVPPTADAFRFAELVVALPPEWKSRRLGVNAACTDDRFSIRAQRITRSRGSQTWTGSGHTYRRSAEAFRAGESSELRPRHTCPRRGPRPRA